MKAGLMHGVRPAHQSVHSFGHLCPVRARVVHRLWTGGAPRSTLGPGRWLVAGGRASQPVPWGPFPEL